jgi:hypothetical protein
MNQVRSTVTKDGAIPCRYQEGYLLHRGLIIGPRHFVDLV